MASLDIFNNDAFSVTTLSASISETPFQPSRLVELGLFQNDPIDTTEAWFEFDGQTLKLVKAGQRGAPGESIAKDRARAVGFKAKHLKRNDALLADAVQNARAFGSDSELDSVMGKVERIIMKHRRDIETTIEYHRMGAIKGQILDADGSTVLEDLFAKFGLTQQTQAMALTTTTTDVRGKAIAAKRKSEDVIGAAPVRGYRAFCGDGFFDAFVSHAKVEAAYDRWMDGAGLRDDVRGGFRFADVIWENYRGNVGGIPFVGTDDAYLVPEGVPDLFVVNFAPADYMETANTDGLPFYAKTDRMPMDRGQEIEVQSNPLAICTRPRSVIKLTKV
ncbi:MAG: major capsid protein [Rhodocyclaceae bacterium]|nr:major capsid protein [Rhodocyclaceae bacterium]